jgi:hypothetical protein
LAQRIVDYIKNYDFKEGEPLKVYGHSHGGNVAKIVTQMMVAQGVERKFDKIIFLATPVVDNYKLNNNALSLKAEVYNVVDPSDFIQKNGGSDGLFSSKYFEYGRAGQYIIDNPIVKNIVVEAPSKEPLVGDHKTMDSVEVLEQIYKK